MMRKPTELSRTFIVTSRSQWSLVAAVLRVNADGGILSAPCVVAEFVCRNGSVFLREEKVGYGKPLEQNRNNDFRTFGMSVFHGFLPAIKFNFVHTKLD
jgi:hypothetical protein